MINLVLTGALALSLMVGAVAAAEIALYLAFNLE